MDNMRKNKSGLKRSGFSLVELMVVIVIIGILGGIVAPRILQNIEKANRTAAKQQIDIFAKEIQKYRIDTKQYPEALIDLVEDPGLKGWQEGGYMDNVPLDPWDGEYQYWTNEGDKSIPFEILCLGPNGNDDGGVEDDIAYPFIDNEE
ncbi:MAG: type II secretion system major pseudopilin GspG [Phycisphaerae bacterium]|nr:type II secretion system major pseudopilin GspG [Phycisphaerae bacterium]